MNVLYRNIDQIDLHAKSSMSQMCKISSMKCTYMPEIQTQSKP